MSLFPQNCENMCHFRSRLDVHSFVESAGPCSIFFYGRYWWFKTLTICRCDNGLQYGNSLFFKFLDQNRQEWEIGLLISPKLLMIDIFCCCSKFYSFFIIKLYKQLYKQAVQTSCTNKLYKTNTLHTPHTDTTLYTLTYRTVYHIISFSAS